MLRSSTAILSDIVGLRDILCDICIVLHRMYWRNPASRL